MSSAFPVVRSQFFYPIWLNELLDWQSYQVSEYVRGKSSAREVADSIIRDIEYPLWMGVPDDSHALNCYHGQYKWCRTVSEDFWDPASMVLGTNKVADCDGSAIALAACLRAIGVKPEDVYVVFGYVRNASSGEVVGGHAYVFCRDPSFGNGDSFSYLEATLDTPPDRYPPVPDIRKPFTWGNWQLVPEIIWNDKYYEEIPPSADLSSSVARFIAGMRKIGKNDIVKVGYFHLRFREKETRRKYLALAEAWQLPVKPLKRAGLLSRLRWRR